MMHLWKGLTNQGSCNLIKDIILKEGKKSMVTINHYNLDCCSRYFTSSIRNHFNSTITSSSSPLYKTVEVSKDGKVTYTSQTVSEILRSSSMHARDLFSLNLSSSDHKSSRNIATRSVRPSAAILPREDSIIMSFGTVRALIRDDSGIIFDAHKPTIQLLADDISHTFHNIHTRFNNGGNCDGRTVYQENQENQENIIIDNQDSFELIFMEEILREVSDTYSRRLKVYEPILDSVVSNVSYDVSTSTGVHRLVPIKDSILEFEIHVQSVLDCLNELLMNDDDLLALNLTLKKQAKEKRYDLDISSHEDVELLIEEYARRLNTILHETKYLLKKIESKQELIAISLDAYRNRMLRMNLYLSIAGIGIGTSTAVAGFYGMNLVSGLENSPTAFGYVVLTTTTVGMLIGAVCISYISGPSMRKRTFNKLREFTLIDAALSHMNSIDYTMKYMVRNKKSMNKKEFANTLLESQPTTNIKDGEVDLLFTAFDITKDGRLYVDDFQSFSHLQVGSKHDAINE